MSSAEATLQIRTSVGNSSPTMLQTLLILSKLYDSNDTDPEKWRDVIESNPRLLLQFLLAVKPARIETWQDSLAPGDLRSIALQFLNYPDHDLESSSNQDLVSLVESIARLTQPDLERRAALCARMVNQDYLSSDPEVAHALQYAAHAPDLLHDTPLLTQIVAVATRCISDRGEIRTGATLLSIDEKTHSSLCSDTAANSTCIDEDALAEFKANLGTINLKLAVTRASDSNRSLIGISNLFFGTARISVFYQNEFGWSDGSTQLRSGHSLVEKTAALGIPLTSRDQQLTAVDENLAETMATQHLCLIPICITGETDSCAAVVVIGSNVALENHDVLGDEKTTQAFCDVARAILIAPEARSIDLNELGQKASEVIHEANNPLSTVQNYLKILSLKLGPEHEAQVTIDSISAELYRTAGIIEKFRDIDSDDNPIEGECKVNDTLTEQAILFRRGSDAIEISFELDESEPVASLNPDRFKQIASNLLKNAVEATRSRGTIAIRSTGNLRQGANRYVEISITDDGPGIDETLEDVFVRGTSSKPGEFGGQGLAIVRDITERAGGYVSYRSRPGETEFRLTLPQADLPASTNNHPTNNNISIKETE